VADPPDELDGKSAGHQHWTEPAGTRCDAQNGTVNLPAQPSVVRIHTGPRAAEQQLCEMALPSTPDGEGIWALLTHSWAIRP